MTHAQFLLSEVSNLPPAPIPQQQHQEVQDPPVHSPQTLIACAGDAAPSSQLLSSQQTQQQ